MSTSDGATIGSLQGQRFPAAADLGGPRHQNRLATDLLIRRRRICPALELLAQKGI